MSASDFSKRMIAQGMKELLKEKPFESISIGDLARKSNISRSTVYYHFKDKYDIVSWIFRTETDSMVSTDRKVGDWTENLLAICLYLQQNRDFYTKVLRDNGQNSFYECLIDYCRELISHMFLEGGGEPVLGRTQIRYIASIYSYGIVGMIAQWSREGMLEDPAPFVKAVKDLISGDVFRKMLSIRES